MILQSYLAALAFIASLNVAMAEPAGVSLPDETLQRYLAQSKLCIAGRLLSVRSEERREQGGAQLLCEVQVLEKAWDLRGIIPFWRAIDDGPVRK